MSSVTGDSLNLQTFHGPVRTQKGRVRGHTSQANSNSSAKRVTIPLQNIARSVDYGLPLHALPVPLHTAHPEFRDNDNLSSLQSPHMPENFGFSAETSSTPNLLHGADIAVHVASEAGLFDTRMESDDTEVDKMLNPLSSFDVIPGRSFEPLSIGDGRSNLVRKRSMEDDGSDLHPGSGPSQLNHEAGSFFDVSFAKNINYLDWPLRFLFFRREVKWAIRRTVEIRSQSPLHFPFLIVPPQRLPTPTSTPIVARS